jgi:hypothetical protein
MPKPPDDIKIRKKSQINREEKIFFFFVPWISSFLLSQPHPQPLAGS